MPLAAGTMRATGTDADARRGLMPLCGPPQRGEGQPQRAREPDFLDRLSGRRERGRGAHFRANAHRGDRRGTHRPGRKGKLALSRLFACPRPMQLDEPSVSLDVASVERLSEAIRRHEGRRHRHCLDPRSLGRGFHAHARPRRAGSLGTAPPSARAVTAALALIRRDVALAFREERRDRRRARILSG